MEIVLDFVTGRTRVPSRTTSTRIRRACFWVFGMHFVGIACLTLVSDLNQERPKRMLTHTTVSFSERVVRLYW